MDCVVADGGELHEAAVFLGFFKELTDPRQPGKVMYPLDEVLLLSLLGVLAGAETFVDIARFGDKKLALLRRFRPFADGTPAHDHLGDIFATLDAEQFQSCFVSWVVALTGAAGEVIAIDSLPQRRPGAKPRADHSRTRAAAPPSIWSRPSQPVSVSCSGKSRWRKSRTKS